MDDQGIFLYPLECQKKNIFDWITSKTYGLPNFAWPETISIKQVKENNTC